jgi:hypothetical protein
MRASEAIKSRVKIAKAARRIGELKRAVNLDGAKVSTTSACTPISRREIASLRVNCLEDKGTIATRAAVIGRRSGMSFSLRCWICSEQ